MDTALQVADALAKLHALNIAHRDLSPRNILRSRIGTFKLGDFGVSRTCRETLHGCAAAAFVGTVAYAAPEDSDDAVCSVTVAADVWAFAATFVEAATGAPPYGDVSWKRVLRRHMQGVAPRLEGHAAAKQVLAACFAMDASARPSAADLLERLHACKSQLCAEPTAPVLRPAAAAVLRDAAARGMRQALADSVLQQLGGGGDATCLHLDSMDATDCVQLAVPLGSLLQLRQLDFNGLNGSCIGAEGAAALAPSLAPLTQLTRLDMCYNSIGAEGAAALAPSLALLTQLAHLEMCSNNIGAEGAAALAPSLVLLTQLAHLDLYRNNKIGRAHV